MDACNNNTNGYIANGHVKTNGHINVSNVSMFTNEMGTVRPENGIVHRMKEVTGSNDFKLNNFGPNELNSGSETNDLNGYANGHLKVQ